MAQNRTDLARLSRIPNVDGDYAVRIAGNDLQWVDVQTGMAPGPSGDIRPLLAQAESRIKREYISRVPLTRNSASALLTRNIVIPLTDTTDDTILETFDRGTTNVAPLERIVYTGTYINDLIASDPDINGDALIRTFDRTNPQGTVDTWSFGFAAGGQLMITFTVGEFEEVMDPQNVYDFNVGEFTLPNDSSLNFNVGEFEGTALTVV